MMTSKTFVSFLALASFSTICAGCAATTAPSEGDEAETANAHANSDDAIESRTAALLAGGGGGLNFSCGALGCICHGDFDCNNMFGGNACGSWPSKCYERGPGPVYCICAPWVGRAAVSTGGAAVGTTSGAVLR